MAKAVKVSKLRDMTAEELAREIAQMREQIFSLRYQESSGQVENPVRIRTLRRDLARALTVQRQRELGAGAGSTR
jgi:large subunit ribosomal protein L29